MIKKMKNKIESMNNEDGMGTIEMIFLVAVLLSLAIMFGFSMKSFVETKLKSIEDGENFEKVDPSTIKSSTNSKSYIALESKDEMLVLDFENYAAYITLNQET